MTSDVSTTLTPNIIETIDFEQALTRAKSTFVSLYPLDEQQSWHDVLALESEPVTKLLETTTYLEILLRARINEAARANLLVYAKDKDLDRHADFYGLVRLVNESDAAFRARIILRIRASSTAGPAVHYRYHALSASADISDVYIDSPRAGLVTIAVIGKDGIASPALVDTVTDYINRPDIKVLTDTVQVKAATVKNITVSATIYMLPDANTSAFDNLQTHLQSAVGSQLGLGRDLTQSWLIHTLHVEGVQRVVLNSPTTDIIINNDQAARIDTVNLTMGGRDY